MKIWKQTIIIFAGFFCIALGLALMMRSGLGMGPWGALEIAIAAHTGLSVGQVVQITSLTLTLFAWLSNVTPTLTTFLHMIFVGLFMDKILLFIPEAVDFFPSALFFLLGLFCFTFGSAQYLCINKGAGPRDGIMIGLAQKTHISIRKARMSVEIVVLLIAAALRGPIGIGTIIFAVLVGPLIQFFMRLIKLL
ncbi:MAG TPA: hypothetical protein DDW93_07715 [Firmicutes bacterium]|nr:hypothetical protein [Bacillota bacterium]HBK67473.1 hypothetical protein [Bacillota bacterium]HBT15478.1 hypothetical protein [Bacillota bacterium]